MKPKVAVALSVSGKADTHGVAEVANRVLVSLFSYARASSPRFGYAASNVNDRSMKSA